MAAIIEIPTHHTPGRGTCPSPALLEPAGRLHDDARVVRPTSVDERRGVQGRRSPVWLAIFAAAIVLVSLLGVASVLGGAPHQPQPVASGEYQVVGPGDTLWSIAAELAPAAPRSRTIDQIAALNGGVDSVDLGDVIALPLLTP